MIRRVPVVPPVGKRGVLTHGEPLHEDVVDPPAGIAGESVERVGRAVVGVGRYRQRVVETPGESLVGRRSGRAVHVAGHHDRRLGGDGVETLHHERGATSAGTLAAVVEVGVQVDEFRAGYRVLQAGPGGDPGVVAVPATASRNRWRLGEPERVVFEQFEAIRQIADRDVLARALSRAASRADPRIGRE